MRVFRICVLTGLMGCALLYALSPPVKSQIRSDTARCLAIADVDERVECLEGRTATSPSTTPAPTTTPRRNPREPAAVQPPAIGPSSNVAPGRSEPISRAPPRTDSVSVQSSAATKQPTQPAQLSSKSEQSSLNVIAAILGLGFVSWFALRIFRKTQRRKRLVGKYGEVIAQRILAAEVWQGMTDEQLVESWGNPADSDREIIKARTKETWKYIQTGKNRFKNRIYLENGIVVGWKI
jgi:hypothetical protein